MEATLVDQSEHTCRNIGPKERAMRMRVGWLGGAVSLVAAAAVVAAQVAWPWRLFLFLPASVSAFGFFQAHYDTCVAFAAANIKVLGDSRKDRVQVTDEAEKAAFRKVSRAISVRAIATAAAFTALAVLL